ncbi:toll/interleukin-1 receptor domain-containing protein [Pseudoxanthomonas mexicana]|uniref:toll/interleukin-1 receptor domain-containing protein n=1 Tax=Pseudoxanthomonas mexicana TaxID=128785 RepID=UPI00398B0AAD
MQSLTPVRESVEIQTVRHPDRRDVFLCHAWDDRQGAAKQLHDLLEAAGVKVWFSEKDLGLGVPMMRAIDKGLANSKVGLVLVTPSTTCAAPKRERRGQRTFNAPSGKSSCANRAQHNI